MAFAFIENGAITQYPVSTTSVRKKYPNTSFPPDLSTADFTGFDVAVVVEVDPPAFDSSVEYLEEGTPTFDGQQWNQVWNTVALTAEELQTRTERLAQGMRQQRNEKLAATDWTQLADNTADTNAWAVYRQALRDVPAQAGFPNEVTWPTEPST